MRLAKPEIQPSPVVEARGVSHSFDRPALDDVSLHVAAGEIHALLGPNGAGKTTLLRILSGLLQPQRGLVRINGEDAVRDPRAIRKHIGLLPSGDGSLYPRLSALENLVFFARLQGFRRRDALSRSHDVLDEVGLLDAAHQHVYAYSHGMQKRLAFARALLTEPRVLLVDEATHDLDPHAAQTVRALTTRAADRGAAVVWTTQRLDEIRGFARTATMLTRGAVCFDGSVGELVGQTLPSRYLLKLQNGGSSSVAMQSVLQSALGRAGTIAAAHTVGSDDYELVLGDEHVIGDVLHVFDALGIRILACREERSGLEEAFLVLTGGRP